MDMENLYEVYLKHPQITTDTRKIKKGDLFFALKGPSFDANEFVAQALEMGASKCIIDNEKYVFEDKTILVDDVLTALQQLAKHHRTKLNIPVIAITGSNGKTTSKELMYAVLSKKYKTIATKGNLNNHIGVPLTLLSIPLNAELAIIEMGANHLHEISSYCDYAMPNFGIINNVGKAHLEGFGSLEGVKKAKGELYDYLKSMGGKVFVNSDLDYLLEMCEGIERITYGSNNKADIQATPNLENGMLQLYYNQQLIKTNLSGIFNSPNVILAIALGKYFEVPEVEIIDAIEKYTPDNSRSQILQKANHTYILDAYNANPTSMKLAIENFALMKAEYKIACIGAMKELGNDTFAEHQFLVDLLAQNNFDKVLLVGKEFENTTHNFLYFDTSTEAGEYLKNKNILFPYTCLLKGSRTTAMEKIMDFIS